MLATGAATKGLPRALYRDVRQVKVLHVVWGHSGNDDRHPASEVDVFPAPATEAARAASTHILARPLRDVVEDLRLAYEVYLSVGTPTSLVTTITGGTRSLWAMSRRSIGLTILQGVALRRGLELGHALSRKVAALRDNDGQPPDHWITPLARWLRDGEREVFIGQPTHGRTLEPQLVHVNVEATLRAVVGCSEGEDLTEWLSKHKTEAAVAIADAGESIVYPDYITKVLDFCS